MNEVTKVEAHEVAQPQQQSDGLLSIIQRVATDQSFDVDKMKALLEMRAQEEERVRNMEREDRAEAAKRAWFSDFSKVQREIGPIVRSRANEHTRSKYADLADIEKVVTPILTKYGFSTTCKAIPCERENHLGLRLIIGHSQGHIETYDGEFPIDGAGSGGKVNKTPIQAKGSTESYGRRYLKASALDLSFVDENDGNAPNPSNEPITEEQFHILRDLIEETGTDEVKFHQAHGHKNPNNATLHEFPARLFEVAKQQLERKKAQMGGAGV